MDANSETQLALNDFVIYAETPVYIMVIKGLFTGADTLVVCNSVWLVGRPDKAQRNRGSFPKAVLGRFLSLSKLEWPDMLALLVFSKVFGSPLHRHL